MNSCSENATNDIQQFEYADADCVSSPERCDSNSAPSAQPTKDESAALAEAEERAYERGKKDGAAQVRTRFDEELRNAQKQIHSAVDAFAEERRKYFEKVETEVVQLSLAIARRVIEREARVDASLLAGMVRVALERIDCKTRVRVRVRPEVADAWRRTFEWAKNDSIEWQPDTSLKGEVCYLETDLGSAEIGIEPTLKEIEQGFFDLLAHRPGTTTRAVMQ